MNNNHKQALSDANDLIDIIEKAGWSIMSIGNVHGYNKDDETFSFISFTVEKKCNHESHGA